MTGKACVKPNFLVIGAQKCGTSWLYEHLRWHPHVFMPEPKELEFFSYSGHLEDPGFDRYLEHFAPAGDAIAVGEATASYFWTLTDSPWGGLPAGFQTDIPAVVHRYLGDELKLVVSLRNPVERVISAYLHYLAEGEITPDMDEEQALAYGGVIGMGFYAAHLRNWLSRYPLEQIKVLALETDIRERPLQTLADLCSFLGVPPHAYELQNVRRAVYVGASRKVNERGVFVPADGPAASDRDGFFRDESGLGWRRVMSAGLLERLKHIFLSDVRDLDGLLGTRLARTWGFDG